MASPRRVLFWIALFPLFCSWSFQGCGDSGGSGVKKKADGLNNNAVWASVVKELKNKQKASTVAEAMAQIDKQNNGAIDAVALKDGVPGLDLSLARAEKLVKQFAKNGKDLTEEDLKRIFTAMTHWDLLLNELLNQFGEEVTPHQTFKKLDENQQGYLKEQDLQKSGGLAAVKPAADTSDMIRVVDSDENGQIDEAEWRLIFEMAGSEEFAGKKKIVDPVTEQQALIEVDHFARRVNARAARVPQEKLDRPEAQNASDNPELESFFLEMDHP